jgi:TolB protein
MTAACRRAGVPACRAGAGMRGVTGVRAVAVLAVVSGLLYAGTPARLPAQDTIPGGVRIGITYTPGRRPALAVVPLGRGPAVDSAFAIVLRDLDHSDRFEMVRAPLERGDTTPQAVLARTAATRAADVLVVVSPSGARVAVTAWDVARNSSLHRQEVADAALPAARPRLHAVSDAIVGAATGQPGIAGTAILFVQGGALARVDADGHGRTTVRSAGAPALSPAWAPDGRRIAYTAFVRSGQPIVLQDLATGQRTVVPTTETALNITPSFAPDGRRLAFARGTEAGTDIYLSEVNGLAAGEPFRLTVGRFADNLSPAWSPDGSRIAFVSTRTRTPQLYVMASDGTGQEILARFDYGATGTTTAPSWSPDGRLIAFHREVAGTPQLFVVDVATGAIRQLTGSGRNEDPSWAPDSRHLVFVSSRTGARELWVLDLETGRLRQLTTVGGARLPAWSPHLSAE